MIHHISIAAQDPRRVAEVLVELFDGQLTRFGPYAGSWIAWATDQAGTAIEVYPLGTEMVPAEDGGQAQFRSHADATGFTATHATVSVNRSAPEVTALAERQGWRAVRLSRGPHDVIEFWIENRVMLEIMTPEMTDDYLRAVPRRGATTGEGSP